MGFGEVRVIRKALTTSRDCAPADALCAPLDKRVAGMGSTWMRRARPPSTWDSESYKVVHVSLQPYFQCCIQF